MCMGSRVSRRISHPAAHAKGSQFEQVLQDHNPMSIFSVLRKNPDTLIQVALWSGAVCLLAGIIAFATPGGYARLVADDFCTAGKLGQAGFWEAQAFWYQQWSGRFAFTFFATLLGALGVSVIPLLPAIYLAWLIILGVYFIHSLLGSIGVNAPPAAVVSLTLLSIFIALVTTPNLSQNLYWMTGSTTYLAPLLVSLMLFSVLLNRADVFPSQPIRSRILTGALVFLLACLNNGFSELMSVLQLFILLIINGYFRFVHPGRKIPALWLLALAGTTIGLAVMVAAPGNAVRGSNFNGAPVNPFLLAANTLRFSATYAVLWSIKNAHILFPSATVVILGSHLVSRHLDTSGVDIPLVVKHPNGFAGIMAAGAFLTVVSFLPSVWITNAAPEDRSKFFASVLLTAMVMFASVWVGARLGGAITVTPAGKNWLPNVLLVGLLYFVAAVPLYQAWNVIATRAAAAEYARAWDARDAEIRHQAAKGARHIRVQTLPPNPYGLEDLADEPTHWLNICMAEYYRLETLTAQ